MKPIHVQDLKKIDPSRYTEGQLFLSDKQIGIIHRGKIDPLVKQSEIKNLVTKSQVEKMIQQSQKAGDKQ